MSTAVWDEELSVFLMLCKPMAQELSSLSVLIHEDRPFQLVASSPADEFNHQAKGKICQGELQNFVHGDGVRCQGLFQLFHLG